MSMAWDSYIAWIDCETTSLDLDSAHLMEIAVVVTDKDLREHASLEFAIRQGEEVLSSMSTWSARKHGTPRHSPGSSPPSQASSSQPRNGAVGESRSAPFGPPGRPRSPTSIADPASASSAHSLSSLPPSHAPAPSPPPTHPTPFPVPHGDRVISLAEACLSDEHSVTLRFAEDRICDLMDTYRGSGRLQLAGSSVYFDKNFLRKWLPRVDERLHFRLLDVSAVMESVRRWCPSAVGMQPPNSTTHSAMDDVRSSLQLMRFYRSMFMACNLMAASGMGFFGGEDGARGGGIYRASPAASLPSPGPPMPPTYSQSPPRDADPAAPSKDGAGGRGRDPEGRGEGDERESDDRYWGGGGGAEVDASWAPSGMLEHEAGTRDDPERLHRLQEEPPHPHHHPRTHRHHDHHHHRHRHDHHHHRHHHRAPSSDDHPVQRNGCHPQEQAGGTDSGEDDGEDVAPRCGGSRQSASPLVTGGRAENAK